MSGWRGPCGEAGAGAPKQARRARPPSLLACRRLGACLAFAEKFVLEPHGLSDEDATAVSTHLSAAEMVAFTEALALFDGFARFQVLLGVAPERAPDVRAQ